MLIGRKIVVLKLIQVLLSLSAKTFWRDFCGDTNRANPSGQGSYSKEEKQNKVKIAYAIFSICSVLVNFIGCNRGGDFFFIGRA